MWTTTGSFSGPGGVKSSLFWKDPENQCCGRGATTRIRASHQLQTAVVTQLMEGGYRGMGLRRADDRTGDPRATSSGSPAARR